MKKRIIAFLLTLTVAAVAAFSQETKDFVLHGPDGTSFVYASTYRVYDEFEAQILWVKNEAKWEDEVEKAIAEITLTQWVNRQAGYNVLYSTPEVTKKIEFDESPLYKLGTEFYFVCSYFPNTDETAMMVWNKTADGKAQQRIWRIYTNE